MIRFECPVCETRLKVADEKAGTKISCPECKERVLVPADEDESKPVAKGKKGAAKAGKSQKGVLIGVAVVACIAVAGGAIALAMSGKSNTPKKDDTKVVKNDTNTAADSSTTSTDATADTTKKTDATVAPGPIPSLAGSDAKTKPPSTGDQIAKADAPNRANAGNELVLGAGANPQEIRDRLMKSTAWILTLMPDGSAWSGTGFLIDTKNRLLVTNVHVVALAEKGALRVLFPDYKRGEVIGEKKHYREKVRNNEGISCNVLYRDPKKDLAVVQLPDLPPGVMPLELAKDSAKAGERIHSLGNAGASGMLWVYTQGHVRGIYADEKDFGKITKDGPNLRVNARWVETDSPTNHGDSGGPTVNDRMQVIGVVQGGINVLVANNISFAVDIKELWRVIHETYRRHPELKMPDNLGAPIEGKRDLTRVLLALKDRSNAKTRALAAEELGQFGADARKAIPDLVATLKDADEDVRLKAAVSLQQIGSITQAQLPALMEALKDVNFDVRVAVLGVISLMSTEAEAAVPAMINALKDKESMMRRKTAEALGRMGPVAKGAVLALASALADESPDVRAAAAQALAQMKNEAIPALKEIVAALKDTNQDVRLGVLHAITGIGPDAAKDTLAELEKILKIRDEKTRAAAIDAIGSFGELGKEAVPFILEYLNEKDLLPTIADAMTKVGKPAVPLLIKKLGDPRLDVRKGAVFVLDKLGSDAVRALPALRLVEARETDPDLKKAMNAAIMKIMGRKK